MCDAIDACQKMIYLRNWDDWKIGQYWYSLKAKENMGE